MIPREHWHAAVAETLRTAAPAEVTLRSLIHQLDLPEDPPPASLPALTLARAVAALGPLLIEKQRLGEGHPVRRTLAACLAFIEAPNEQTWSFYFDAATDSYPFGPGDGCHCLLPSERHGERGGGCISGAGTLMSIAHEVGMDAAVAELRRVLLPWLDTLE